MNRAPRRGLTALVLVSAVSACSNDPTEIVVVVHSDLAVPSAIDSLRIDVLEPDGETKSSTLALASAASLPGRLGVTHGSGALYPVEIVATGLAAGRPIVTQRARVGFVPNRSRLLELFLLDACRDVSCDAETTCEGGVCLSIERGTLPPWRGRVPGFDAGAAFDAAPHDGSTDAGTDAPRDGGPDDASVDPCDEPRRLPPRPSIEDTPGGEPPRFYAMRALDYGTPLRLEPGCPYEPNPVARPRTIFELGYDIDGARTAHGTTVECSPFDPMRGPGNDGCGGVDNVLGALYGLIATGFGCSLAELGDHIESGRGGFLLWVRGWNGAPDDRRVEVAILPTSYGVTSSALRDGGAPEACRPSGRDAGVDPSPTGEALRWDGTDVWFVAEASGGELGTWDCDRVEPFARDQDAYVVDGLLVSVINRVVPVRFGPCLALPLGNPVITARISESALSEGIVHARVSVAAVRAAIPLFDVPDGPTRDNIDDIIEANADVNTECGYSETRCEADPGVPCDALSTGLGFDAARATFGGVRPQLAFRCD